MAGTKIGGKKAAATNKANHGEDFYREIGRKGGLNGNTGGFASMKKDEWGLTGPERAKIVGQKGGRISRRTGIKNGESKKWATTA